MDNLCHALAGWALARTGLGRPASAPATPAPGSAERTLRPMGAAGRGRPPRWAESLLLVVGSNVPDADLVLGMLGPEAYLLWHRGLTHSVLGLLLFPPPFAYLSHAAIPGLSFGRALLLWEVAFVSHIALDLPTSWGTLVLYPWSHARQALDWVFIVDPALWAILLAGIVVGVRRAEAVRRRAAAGSLVAALLYVLASGATHGTAAREARGALEPGGEAGHEGDLDVFPLPLSPLRWHAIAWRGDSLVHVSLRGLPPRVRAVEREPHRLGEPSVRRALLTPPGQAYLWWARAPAARAVEEAGGRTVVWLGDRRFAPRGDVFGIEITLDERGELLQALWEGQPVFEGGR